MKENLVSIITPVYNSEKYLESTLNSVLGQTYPHWEHILVDDCSTDSSRELLTQWSQQDSRIRILFNDQNRGAGYSRNRAIEMARGRYIAFLDSDDIWEKKKLEIQIGFMQQHNAAFCHTSYGYLDENGNDILRPLRVSSKPVTYQMLLKRTEISCLTAIYDVSVLGKCYMTEHRLKQDYALWLSILKRGYVSQPIDVILAYYRQRKKSATSKKWKLIWNHVIFLRETQKMSTASAVYYTLYWALNGLFRYYIVIK